MDDRAFLDILDRVFAPGMHDIIGGGGTTTDDGNSIVRASCTCGAELEFRWTTTSRERGGWGLKEKVWRQHVIRELADALLEEGSGEFTSSMEADLKEALR